MTTQYCGQLKETDFYMKSLLNTARLDHIFLNTLSLEMNKNKLFDVPTVYIYLFPSEKCKNMTNLERKI